MYFKNVYNKEEDHSVLVMLLLMFIVLSLFVTFADYKKN